jgi:Peptidase_G2, IMC autoproteolytic cleavage domain
LGRIYRKILKMIPVTGGHYSEISETAVIANERMRISSAGNVGIGTTSPQGNLHVKGSTDYGSLRLSPTTNSGEAAMAFYNDAAGTTTSTAWVVGQGPWVNPGKFIIGNQAASGPVLTATTAGYVGIGTTSPQAKLHVEGGAICVSAGAGSNDCSGAANTAGTIFAVNTTVQGADYAEYFATEDALTPGDIVGINLRSGLVRRYHAGDNLVGVVSTQPGVIGNSKIKDKNSVLVALMGQVPFNRQATSTHGNIVKTPDGVQIGYVLASGDLYLQMSSTEKKISKLKAEKDYEIAQLKAEKDSEVAQLKAVICEMKPEAAICSK